MSRCRLVLWLVLVAALAARPARAGEVLPPEVLTRAEATVPPGAPPPTQDHVLLEFTVSEQGRAEDLVVLESAGPAWDAAAKEALARWTFKPALHEGVAVAARTRLSFSMPARREVDAGVGAADGGAGGAEAPHPPHASEVFDDALDGGHGEHVMSTVITGRLEPKSRGASDLRIEVGQLKLVPRQTAGDLLKLAPGILLTNEGGDGHPERIFLRGFDAREGQDLELTVDGVPVNDVGNLHGNGYADLNFVIPELVEQLRVIEGPFDPRQGNFAVAGSAAYELGLKQRGLTVKGTYGSFDTQRVVLLWGPPAASTRTFGGVSLQRTAGFGQNRAAQSARAAAGYEGRLSETTSLRVQAIGYAAGFRSAGVLRDDDLRAGRVGFFDSLDPRQGGDATRASLSGDLHYHLGGFTAHQQAALVFRSSRIRENFTGFLTDVQLARQAPHGQRGDLIDRDSEALTLVASGYGRMRGALLSRSQELELGYFARYDVVTAQQQRLLAGPDVNTPYAKDADLSSRLSDVGLYADANLSFTPWLTLRGGLRADLLTFLVNDACAVGDVRRPSAANPPGDQSCLAQRDFGQYREPTERASAFGVAVMPRATLLVGPFKGVTLTGSVGDGVRSVDPQFVTENRETPFASIRAWEGGVVYAAKLLDETLDVSARGVVFGTRVDKDLVFNEQEGRNLIGGSTSRLGGLVQARARGGFFDVQGHGTFVRSQFDDTGLLVPYVPDLVLRLDAALFKALPWRLFDAAVEVRAGVGVTYVGRRALPFGERSDVIFVTDANVEASWRGVTLGLSALNLFDTRYRLSEFNFASDFRTAPPFPTLVPVRHFTAGAPRTVLLTLAFSLGGAP
ncbi:MAG: TonB-dependent receptor [Myxococcaceae bacterium]|jgi:iron complex outermembrane receptor protein|nr:TonB-dependent receptor [Myxococcaceae bacterium]MCA3016204.1 TonB-dependent receptor [Myxococcaceae bacterium]